MPLKLKQTDGLTGGAQVHAGMTAGGGQSVPVGVIKTFTVNPHPASLRDKEHKCKGNVTLTTISGKSRPLSTRSRA